MQCKYIGEKGQAEEKLIAGVVSNINDSSAIQNSPSPIPIETFSLGPRRDSLKGAREEEKSRERVGKCAASSKEDCRTRH